MSVVAEYIILSLLASVFVVATRLSSLWPWPQKGFRLQELLPATAFRRLWQQPRDELPGDLHKDRIEHIMDLAECHETAACLAKLIKKDGAGSWPPRVSLVWPAAIKPYMEIYHEMAPLLPAATASLDDEVNRERIDRFRSRFSKLLAERVNLSDVTHLLDAADAGRWDVFPRDAYNAFYCCVAWCRHAYRWGTIPAVRVAQLEKTVSLPPELLSTWASLQRHFGLASDSGNMMSNLVLNFSLSEEYIFKINTGLPDAVTGSEEEFARVAREMEGLAVPVYHHIVRAILAWARGDRTDCLEQVRGVASQLRPLLSSYYDRVHDARIARSVWLSHVQGFYAWAAGYQDPATGEWVTFDGLSGNQVLLFQVLDSFLGIEPYLTREVLERNVPALQREFCSAISRHTFRHRLGEDNMDGQIRGEFTEIVKRLRVFRMAHRTRAKGYLLQPAPERLPMTAGKSLLKEDMDQSLQFLDEFMLNRLQQTV